MGGTRIIAISDRCAKLNERVAQFDAAVAANAPLAEPRAALDQEFWRAVTATVEGLVQADLPKDIAISRDDQALISFGLPPGPRFAARAGVLPAPVKNPAFVVHYLHDTIAGAYRDALRLENLSRLRGKLAAIAKEVDEWPDAHLEYVKQRDKLVEAALANAQQAQQLLLLYSELDERVEKFKLMERQNQNEGWRTAEDRKAWLDIRGYIDQREQAVAKLLEPLTRNARAAKERIDQAEVAVAQFQRNVRDAERAVNDLEKAGARDAASAARAALESARAQVASAQKEADSQRAANAAVLAAGELAVAADAADDSVNRLLDLRNERRLVESQILDEENTVHQITVGEVKGHLLNEVGNVRSMLRLAAKYGRVAECAVPVEEPGVAVEPAAALAALAEIEEFDPQLFANAGIKRFGKPSVIFAPGAGDGVYDTDRNRLVIPQRAMKSPLESVAHAVVLYRLDMDAAYDDRRLFRAYQEQIKDNTGVRSNLKLRMGLMQDYLTWVTREAQGNVVLSRETREWFERHIAPPRHHPMIPREFTGLTQRQLHQKLDETDRGSATGEREYRVAVLHWLLDPADSRAMKETVLPRIENALKLSPDTPAHIYSAAALLKLAGQKDRAGELFTRFATTAKQSWWTRKAVELAQQCRG